MDQRERVADSEEALMMALDGAQAKIWTSLPGTVAAVNLSAQTVSVQPTVRGRVTGKSGAVQSVNMPLLVDVPIVWPRAGGFALTFPVAVGDEVLVTFASRAIDAWWQSGGIGEPVESRMHDLSDGFAILAPTSQPKKLSGVSATNVQLRNEAGNTFVEITPAGNVNIVATGSVAVTSPSSINLTAPTIALNGAVTASNSMSVTGTIAATGDITTPANIIAGTVSLKTHVHSGVQAGGSNTGLPV